MNRTLTAALMLTAALVTNAAFTILSSAFDYPDILKQPTEMILAAFRDQQGAVMLWFAVMAASAALFAPIAVGVGRLSAHPAMRWAVPTGVAAAVVQVVGLSRWPLLVPGFATDAGSTSPATAAQARASFETAHLVLGNIVGETLGYLFTAAWTVFVLIALRRTFAGLWFTMLGVVSAALIAAGIASPTGLEIVDDANFVGYILWSVWLLAFAVLLLRRRTGQHLAVTPGGSGPEAGRAGETSAALAGTGHGSAARGSWWGPARGGRVASGWTPRRAAHP